MFHILRRILCGFEMFRKDVCSSFEHAHISARSNVDATEVESRETVICLFEPSAIGHQFNTTPINNLKHKSMFDFFLIPFQFDPGQLKTISGYTWIHQNSFSFNSLSNKRYSENRALVNSLPVQMSNRTRFSNTVWYLEYSTTHRCSGNRTTVLSPILLNQRR